MDVELGAVGDRVVDLVGSDFTQQGRDFGICVLGPDQFRIAKFERRQHIGVAAARKYFDAFADDVLDTVWLALAEPVDELHVHRFVGMAEIQVLLARLRDRQAGSGHVHAALEQTGHDLRHAGDGLDDQRNAEPSAKPCTRSNWDRRARRGL